MTIKVSVAIATYNGSRYLPEQLDSIYAQTMLPDEVVVCDDCSSDNTIEILKEYSLKYGLKYYVNECNLGYTKNFENVLQKTNGEYVCICDQDDVWLDSKIETLYNEIIKYNRNDIPVVVASRAIQVNADKKQIYKEKCKKIQNWKYWVWGEFSQGCTMIINRCAINTCIPIPRDVIYDAYIGGIAALAGEWYKIPDKLMEYRHHAYNALAKDRKRTFKDKFVNKNKYGWLMVDEHFQVLKVIKANHKELIKPERLYEVNKVLDMDKTSNKAGLIKHCLSFKTKSSRNVLRTIVSIMLKE